MRLNPINTLTKFYNSVLTTNERSTEEDRNTVDTEYKLNKYLNLNERMASAINLESTPEEEDEAIAAVTADFEDLTCMAELGDEDAIELMVQLYVFSEDNSLLIDHMKDICSFKPELAKLVSEVAQKLVLLSLKRKDGTVPDYEFTNKFSQNMHELSNGGRIEGNLPSESQDRLQNEQEATLLSLKSTFMAAELWKAAAILSENRYDEDEATAALAFISGRYGHSAENNGNTFHLSSEDTKLYFPEDIV